MTHLYLIRHADYIYDLVDGKYPKRDQGLSTEGRVQAERLRNRLAQSGEIKPDVFISSTARGAHETAQVIAPVLGKVIVLDKDFEEWRSDDGSLTSEEFMARWQTVPDIHKPYYRWVEGGENRAEFGVRVQQALDRAMQTYSGKTILAVTHGAFIQMSFGYFFGLGEANWQRAVPDINRTSITHWYKTPESHRWSLERSNDCQHLLNKTE